MLRASAHHTANLSALIAIGLTQLTLPRGGAAQNDLADLTGRVVTGDDAPIPDARVLVILKTWPNNRFRQQAFSTKTDAQGNFRLEKLYPQDRRHAVLTTAVVDGKTLASSYTLHRIRGVVEPVRLELDNAHPLRVRFLDREGKPVKDVPVFPNQRVTTDREPNIVYFQGSEPVWQRSDEKGFASLSYFQKDDRAAIYFQFPGDGWERENFVVRGTEDEVLVVRQGEQRSVPQRPFAADAADVPSQQLTIDNDPNKTYFLIGPTEGAETPADGFGLVVVMPGGSGSADFHPFVKRISKYALGTDYVVAQPVAFKWTPEQRIVWPTKPLPTPGMEFSTEEFVEAIVADVATKRKIDHRRVFTLSWSSSGPAAYAISLQPSKSITGSYVAMSVFRPKLLPPLENAAGHAYYILHSPDDRVCPFRMAEQARESLRDRGAAVEFRTYAGGHGWHGDPFANIRAGINWLAEHAARDDDKP